MKRIVRILALVLVTLLVLPGWALAQEAPAEPDGNNDEALAQDIQEEVEQFEEVDTSADAYLDTDVTLQFDDPNEPPVTVTVREALVRIAGRTFVDTENNGGTGGTAETALGNILHIYVDANVEVFPLILPTALPPEPDVSSHYDVVESQYTPNTPIVPVPNPLLLAGVPAPEGAPEGLSSPILFMHAGGKLKNVRGSGWDSATHTVGSGPLGMNIDTAPRETTDEDPWPIWLPVVTGGALPDTSIDFTGFAQVIEGQGCTLVTRVIFGVERVLARVCIGIGVLFGDGLSFLSDEPPVDVRSLPAIWDPAPEPVPTVMAAVDDALSMVDVFGLVDQLPLDQLPEVPPPPG